MLIRWFGLAAVGLLLAGCQSPEVSVADASAPVSENVGTSEVGDPVDAQLPDDTPTAAPAATAAVFQPPFPARSELFAPPRRGQNTVRRDDEHGETIELKGFVDVNGPQVVLSIDGVISPIPAGGEKYGVQVISIDPPHVVLQRGRSRWTASLE